MIVKEMKKSERGIEYLQRKYENWRVRENVKR